MSLEHLKVSRNIIHPIVAVGLINFVLVSIILIMTTTVFATPSGIELKFPYQLEQGDAQENSMMIEITSENVIYLDKRVLTLNELRRYLAQANVRNGLISVKADRHASMGRVADILDLCRGIPGVRVNVSTTF